MDALSLPERVADAQRVHEQAEIVVDEGAVRDALDRMAGEITADLASMQPVLVCVLTGGLFATAELGARLNFPLELDYLHATRYRGATTGAGLAWRASPALDLSDRHVLIVDDILDQGHTLAAIVESIAAQSPASVRTAMLCRKQGVQEVDLSIDYLGFEVPDRYVYGCGMDYRGFHRQLPAVYAVADT